MAKKIPVFTYDDCVNCRMCVQACPFSCLSMTREGLNGKYKNLFPEMTSSGCIGCAMCERSCPMGCISMVENDED